MLIDNFIEIGNRLLLCRKQMGLTQAQVAEEAGLSDRTYADIERGNANARLETLLRICNVLQITPNDVLVEKDSSIAERQQKLWERLNACTDSQKITALRLLETYLNSINVG